MPEALAGQHPYRFDEEAFLRRMPYKVVKTNLPGAYTSLALTDDFDPNTASLRELRRRGLPWRRPNAEAEPCLRAAWHKVFARKWLARDQILPESIPQVGKTHLLRQRPVMHMAGTTTTAWAGAVLDTGTWGGIIGFWTIPTVSVPPQPQGKEGGWNSSSWIGLDGWYSSNDVLQAGIEQTVDANGVASYVAWYEWFAPETANSPGYIYQTNISNFPVAPGQEVYCSLGYAESNSVGAIYFANGATHQWFRISLVPPPGASFDGQSAEWILEAPDGGEPTSSLPSFTPITFTTAVACQSAPVGGGGTPADGELVNITTPAGMLLTSVGTGDGTLTISFVG